MGQLYLRMTAADVYLLVGRMNSGGTIADGKILMGIEMFGRADGVPLDELSDWHRRVLMRPQALANLVVHELVHVQQFASRAKGKSVVGDGTLLAQCIIEGSADFVAELAGCPTAHRHIHTWGLRRESELWMDFRRDMHGTDCSRWLYNGATATDRPADLGYFVGYRIVESYYRAASNKQLAAQDILEIADYPAFLEKSGYTGAGGQ